MLFSRLFRKPVSLRDTLEVWKIVEKQPELKLCRQEDLSFQLDLVVYLLCDHTRQMGKIAHNFQGLAWGCGSASAFLSSLFSDSFQCCLNPDP